MVSLNVKLLHQVPSSLQTQNRIWTNTSMMKKKKKRIYNIHSFPSSINWSQVSMDIIFCTGLLLHNMMFELSSSHEHYMIAFKKTSAYIDTYTCMYLYAYVCFAFIWCILEQKYDGVFFDKDTEVVCFPWSKIIIIEWFIKRLFERLRYHQKFVFPQPVQKSL